MQTTSSTLVHNDPLHNSVQLQKKKKSPILRASFRTIPCFGSHHASLRPFYHTKKNTANCIQISQLPHTQNYASLTNNTAQSLKNLYSYSNSDIQNICHFDVYSTQPSAVQKQIQYGHFYCKYTDCIPLPAYQLL